jgi:hypothetical protein
MAMLENHLTCRNISMFGFNVAKIPQPIFDRVAELKIGTPKTHKYTFQGHLNAHSDKRHSYTERPRRRQWVKDFVKQHFSSDDIFIEGGKTMIERMPISDGLSDSMDPIFYSNLASSIFTLTPGGDYPWSGRFYEAIMAGSIPVINTVEQDLSHETQYPGSWFSNIGYKYFTTDQVLNMSMSSAELKSMADENYRLLLKYQTFMHGDQVPPAYTAAPCISDDSCLLQCQCLFMKQSWP